jgi:glycosyltransferase involved in cell wall biosynthesis
VIHLHWINNEMISIKEIAKIKKPIIWTLHDCWPLLGAEHHSSSDYWKVSHTAEPTEGRQALQRQSNERSEWQRRGWRGATAMNEVSGNKHKKEIFQQPLPLEDVRGGQRGHPKTEISGRSSACNKQCPESSGQPCCTGVDSAHNGSLKTGFREAVLRRIATVYSSFLRVPSRSFAVKRNLLCLTRLFTRTTEGSGCKKSSSMLHTPCSWLSGVVNRYIFGLKKRAWKQLHVSFIAPSNWMAEQVKKSELFTDAPVTVIPNCLDLDVFKPLEQSECRKKLGLPLDKKLILFGAFNPFDPNKGLDLLEEALNKLPEEARRCVGVVVFGLRPGGAYAPEGCEGERKIGGLETYWMGSVGSEQEMAAVYNAGDCTCVPSRRESFGYTAAESLACGIPVAAFRTSGLVDIVDHQETGWLAEPYDPEDLSRGIFWVLAGNPALSAACRRKAEAMLSPEAVVRSHSLIYSDLITLTDNRNLRFQ